MIINTLSLENNIVLFQNLETKSIKEKGIDIEYPYEEGNKDINKMEEYALEEKEKFLNYSQNNDQLIITYDTYVSKNFLGFIFYILVDTHGAHPNTYIKTFSYSKAGLIDPKSRYTQADLDLFSNYCTDQLKPKLEENQMYIEDMFKEGMKPTYENFNNIIELDDEIIIFFSQYQIAPYVMGIMECRISKNLFYINHNKS